MGNFEKLSVLVIVVIIVMILVVALYTWQDTGDTTTDKEELAKSDYVPAATEDPWPSTEDLFEEDIQADKVPSEVDHVPPMPPSPEPASPPATDPHDVPPLPVMPGPGGSGSGGSGSGTDGPSPDEGPWMYTIKGGDTISQICERELGTWRRQKEVFALNPGLDPLTIRVGDKLKMPARGRASSVKEMPSGAAAGAKPLGGAGKPTPGEWYVLRNGDRMSTISKRAYGNIERWPELWARNLSVVKDPDAVQAGTRIFIPK